jgi:isoquinoline 1-oxidoreductase beta subunit
MDRRSFIKSGAVLGSGLLVGFSLKNNIAVAGPAALSNPWLKIEADNSVTIFVARSEMGQDVYTSMSMLIADELDYPLGKVKINMAPADAKLYGNDALGGAQITGGSTSMRDAWIKLRTVGATAREMLLIAAAQKWNVAVDKCVASDGFVTSGSNKASYGELAQAASAVPHNGKPVLKTPAQFKYIGKQVGRLDTPSKVNGSAIYGVDVRQPGMLAASLAMSPVIGGKVVSYDDSAAKAVSGVLGIVQIPDGVAVLAKDYFTAKKARDLLKVKWDNGNTAAVADMAAIKKGLREASKKKGAVIGKAGNVQAPLAGTVKKLTAEYQLPFVAHATLEPVNCSAMIANGECHVWGPIQFQQGAQGVAAAAAGLPAEKVFIHTTFLGGGYGRKLELDFIGQVVAIAKASAKPVRLIWSREDDMTHDFYRPISLSQLEGGFDNKGNLVGLSSKLTSPSVTARAFPGFVVEGSDPFMNEGSANLTYDIKNFRAENVIHDTGIRVGYWRAVSNNLNAFAIESFMDELAAAAGKDPVDFRMNLLAKHPRAQKVLSTAAQKAGWGQLRQRGRALGVAQMECYDAYIAVVAEVSLKDGKPTVHKLTCAVDPGVAVRPDQVLAQIESGLLLGFSTAMKNQITFKDGAAQQTNFDSYPMLRMSETPAIDITVIEGGDKPSGLGEVGVPLAAPAIANAIVAAGGQRIRSLPFLTA